MAALGLLLLATATAVGADDRPSADGGRLGEVVVTAPAVAAEAAREDATAFATVIDTTAAPTSVDTLAEALSDAVGVQVRRYGGLGDFSTVSIRGFAAGQVQIYLDGVPLARADNETVNLSDLPLDAVERVEVYRATTPLAFAQSGPGGVVNIVTRRPSSTPVTAASASYGSFTTRKVDLMHAQASGTWDVLGFAHYLGSAGNFEFTNEGAGFVPNPDQVLRRKNNDFDLGNLTGRVGWRPTPLLSLALTSDSFVKQEGVPGTGTLQSRDARLDTLRQLVHLGARLDGLPFDVESGAYVLYQRDQFSAPADDPFFHLRVDTDERTTATGGQVLMRGALGAHQVPGLLLAGSHEVFSFLDRARLPPGSPDRTRDRGTIAGEDEILLFDTRVSVVPALRWEIFRDDFPGDRSEHRVVRTAPGVQVRDFFSPHLGLRGEAGAGFTLLGNLGRYAREPNLSELFGNRGAVRGNPTLKPEVAFNRDAGFRWRGPARGPFSDVGFEYAFFDNDIDDLIVLRQNTASIAIPVNVGAAHIQGHELDGRLRLWRRVGVVANYTHQSAIDQGQDPDTNGKRIPGRPADEAYGRLELTWSPATPLPFAGPRLWPGRAFYEANFIGDDFLDRANTPEHHLGSRVFHGVGIELALPVSKLRLAVEVKNLGDDHTRDAFAYPLPGRSWFATLSYGFGVGDVPPR